MTIRDLIDHDEHLQHVLRELLELGYLAPGVFHPQAYLIDCEKVKSECKHRRRNKCIEIQLIAVGVLIHNQFFSEVVAEQFAGRNPTPTASTSKWLDEWEQYVELHSPTSSEIK